MFAHHVWIDHCDLSNGFDGLIDIKRGADYITVSWNHTHNHVKNMLLGHADNNGAQDIGRLKVSYHHNWFNDTPQRNPRVRFGEPVHIFNNYFFSNSDVGVACQANAGCVVEGNYFEDVEEPMTIHYAGPTGRMIQRNNVFVGESGSPGCRRQRDRTERFLRLCAAERPRYQNDCHAGRRGRKDRILNISEEESVRSNHGFHGCDVSMRIIRSLVIRNNPSHP